MNEEKKELLKKLPKVDLLLKNKQIKSLLKRFPKRMVVEEIRSYLKDLRSLIVEQKGEAALIDQDTMVLQLTERASIRLESSLKRAVNGIGIILHTNLGRAPFAVEAQKALMDATAGYCTLEIDQESGRRGDRYQHIEKLLCQLTGAEASMIVNNNAAATMLILNTLAMGKEVIVSRGELIEIGGAFRIPDVMKKSGAILVEAGTTNRTHLRDYEAAINENTGMILRVHQSNYAIIGFTKMVELKELVDLAHRRNILAVDDIGSGALIDFHRFGLPKEPMVQDSVKAGYDVVCFSGDKLLGGPQCGVIVGKKNCIDQMKKNQLTRALRCDKMTYAVMEATIRIFLDEKKLMSVHPVIRMLKEQPHEIKKRCMALKRKIKLAIGEKIKVRLMEDVSEVGSGSMAASTLPTWVLALRIPEMSAEAIATAFRMVNPPVFGRIKEDKFLLDCRTIQYNEFKFIVSAFESIFGEGALKKTTAEEVH